MATAKKSTAKKKPVPAFLQNAAKKAATDKTPAAQKKAASMAGGPRKPLKKGSAPVSKAPFKKAPAKKAVAAKKQVPSKKRRG